MSVEHGGEVLREILKAIMVAQFVTPLESCLSEKSFRMLKQVHSPLISLLLGGCRGVRACVFDIAYGRSTGVVRLLFI